MPTESQLPIWNNVNVVYSYNETDGSVTNIVVSEDPGLTRVVEVTVQQHAAQFSCLSSCGTDDEHSSGFEFSKSGYYQSIPVYEVYTSWTMPDAQNPSDSENCGLGSGQYWCHFAIWNGLENEFKGLNGIVQGGTENKIECLPTTCNKHYRFWYEFYPNSSVECGDVHPGDSMASDVLDTAILYGGPPTHHYHIWVYDYTTQQTCWADQNFPQMGTSYLAAVASETPSGCGGHCGTDGYYRLPVFYNPGTGADILTMSNCGLDLTWGNPPPPGWNHMGCYTPFSQGWWNAYFMVKGTCRNIYLHSVLTDNSFNQDWLTSCGS